MDISKGRYWDLPWSLVDGCTPCSPGCERCWSAAMTARFDNDLCRFPMPLTSKSRPINKFLGKIICHPERLSIPMKRRKPTVYAVWNDLFHEAVPDDFIAETYMAIYDTRVHYDHTFLILTKRATRMLDVTRRLETGSLCAFMDGDESGAEWVDKSLGEVLPNVYHGLTVCNQAEADAKIPVFLEMPGKKFLSIEPMLGAMDVRRYLGCTGMPDCLYCETGNRVHAVILGGETGPGARPMHPDWVRSVRDQCAAAGVQFFFKQWGEFRIGQDEKFYRDGRKSTGRRLDGRTHDELAWIIE